MRIRISALADYASISEGNKLNILGIFTRIHTGAVPFRHNEMQLVVQMIFDPNDVGEKHARIYVEDIDGKIILQLEGDFIVPPAQNHEPVTINQILKLQGIIFPDFGSYECKIEIDGETHLLTPLEILPLPPELQNRV